MCWGGDMRYQLTHNKVKKKKCQPFCEERTRFYIAQIIAGISYMHEQGVLHRDIKPDNMLVSYITN